MAEQEAIARAQVVKQKHERELLRKRNVVGVGIGLRQRSGLAEVCIIVSVSQKMPLSQLAPHDVVPPLLEDVPVEVQETGPFRAH